MNSSALHSALLISALALVHAGRYLPEDYNRGLRPTQGNESTHVHVSLRVNSFGPVNELNMEVATEIYLRLSWTDPRLITLWERVTEASGRSREDDDGVFLAGDYYREIWKPDTYFPDAVMLERPVLEEDDSVFLFLKPDGRVVFSMRINLKTHCDLDFSDFPMDSQICSLCISHYKYPQAYQKLLWHPEKEKAVRMSNSIALTPKFIVEVNKSVDKVCREEYIIGYEEINYTYSSLCMHIHFTRRLKQYIFTMYLPSLILVLLSFINFWIDKKAVPARASLSITTILAQITLMTGTAVRYPAGSSLKLIDIYQMTNFLFTFATMVEYAIISYTPLPKQATVAETHQSPENQKLANGDKDDAIDESRVQFNMNDPSSPPPLIKLPDWVKRENSDKISRVVFPLVFSIWNLFYLWYGWKTWYYRPEIERPDLCI